MHVICNQIVYLFTYLFSKLSNEDIYTNDKKHTIKCYVLAIYFIYYEIVHEYTIKKKKEKVKLSSIQKINHA